MYTRIQFHQMDDVLVLRHARIDCPMLRLAEHLVINPKRKLYDHSAYPWLQNDTNGTTQHDKKQPPWGLARGVHHEDLVWRASNTLRSAFTLSHQRELSLNSTMRPLVA